MPDTDVIKSKLGAMRDYLSDGLRNKMTHDYEKIQRQKMLNDIVSGIDQYSRYMKVIADYMEKIETK